jgi:hypothetical protein
MANRLKLVETTNRSLKEELKVPTIPYSVKDNSNGQNQSREYLPQRHARRFLKNILKAAATLSQQPAVARKSRCDGELPQAVRSEMDGGQS